MPKVSPYVYPGLAGSSGDLSMMTLTYAVCSALNMNFNDVMGQRRFRSLVEARFALYYCLIRREKKTYSQVGRHFNRDHSSVVNGVQAWERLLSVNDKDALSVQRQVNNVYHNLKNQQYT